ncbi:MAG TPA: hypothetical protein VFA34_02460 [Actinomycetota bacterium]|nr:hypothetical protein [Actinomycetota bacterium]
MRFAAFLRAGFRFAAFFRAGLRFAAFLRAGFRFAAFFRAGLRFAALRAGLRFAAFLRAGFLRAVDLRAVDLRRDRFAALRGIQFTSLLRSDDLEYATHLHVPTYEAVDYHSRKSCACEGFSAPFVKHVATLQMRRSHAVLT